AGLRLQEGLEAIWRNPRRVLITTAMHMAGWLIGTLEILIAMSLMGHPVTLTEATIIESLTNAIRGAAFAIPGGFGVQEGGLVLLGHLMGIAPETALALSLVKRVPDLALGLPGLLAWHWLEVRRFLGIARTVPTQPAPAERRVLAGTPPAAAPASLRAVTSVTATGRGNRHDRASPRGRPVMTQRARQDIRSSFARTARRLVLRSLAASTFFLAAAIALSATSPSWAGRIWSDAAAVR